MLIGPPDWLLRWSEVIGALGTVTLTVFLVILYKRQQEQLAANHAAILDISDVEWSKDTGTFSISNLGNGAVRHLQLITVMRVDTGAHREHVIMKTFMKRQDKGSELSSVIQPGEEDIPFQGKSKVGILSPAGWSRDWYGQKFSHFIKNLKTEGASEVKYRHIVQRWELSNKRNEFPFILLHMESLRNGLNRSTR